jgi:hypothetical protein
MSAQLRRFIGSVQHSWQGIGRRGAGYLWLLSSDEYKRAFTAETSHAGIAWVLAAVALRATSNVGILEEVTALWKLALWPYVAALIALYLSHAVLLNKQTPATQ